MEITSRGLWTLIHGIGFGALYLLACSGALVELYRVTAKSEAPEFTSGRERFLKVYLITMVALAWAAVLTGTFVIYPWYRAAPPEAAALAGGAFGPDAAAVLLDDAAAERQAQAGAAQGAVSEASPCWKRSKMLLQLFRSDAAALVLDDETDFAFVPTGSRPQRIVVSGGENLMALAISSLSTCRMRVFVGKNLAPAERRCGI
jgi:hypothetical protein